jgi:hypothetical protein
VANSNVCAGVSTAAPVESGVEFGLGEGLTVAVAAGIGLGLANLIGVGVGLVRGVEVGLGDSNNIRGVGVGLGKVIGVAVGLGNNFNLAVDIGVGISKGSVALADGLGDGAAVNSFSASCSVSFFGIGETVTRVLGDAVVAGSDPGSDQPLAFSPFTKFACNLVFPCCLITGPSNFPPTILPV